MTVTSFDDQESHALPGGAPSPWLVLGESLNGYIRTEVLTAACELGLFSFLERSGTATLAQVAGGCGISEQAARILVLGCCEAKLTERGADGTVHNTPVASTYLVEGAPYSMLAFVRFTREVQQKTCNLLAEAFRAGRAAGLRALGLDDTMTLYQAFAQDKELESLFHEAMAEYSRFTTLETAPEDLEGVRRLLDIGGGNASVQMRLLSRHPGVTGTLFDLPTVCKKAAENVRATGGPEMVERISFHPGDIFADELPKGYDAVLIHHFIEIFDPEAIRLIYGKVARALEPGGRLLLWTVTANDDETGPLQAVKSSVYFYAAAGGNGMTYPPSDHRRWLAEVGLEVVTERPHPEICHTFFVARKR